MSGTSVRITSALAKTTFVLAWWVSFLLVLSLMSFWELPPDFNLFTASAIAVVYFVIGVRTFRGKSEPVAPRRKWWRATATSRSSIALGAGSLSLSGLVMFGLIEEAFTVGRTAPYAVLVILLLTAGVFYVHSGIRAHVRRSRPRPASR